MGYRRTLLPDPMPAGDELDAMLAGIGCAVAAAPLRDANIEDALLGAVVSGMEEDHLRRLGLAVQWIAQHARAINADRLVRAVPLLPGERSRACWAAIARWHKADRRWKRLGAQRESADLLRVGNAFQMQRRGPDHRFVGTALRVPAGTLRALWGRAGTHRPGEMASRLPASHHARPQLSRRHVGDRRA